MGRSVSQPRGTLVACYQEIEDDDMHETYDYLVDDIRECVQHRAPSFEEIDRWVGREDRALLQNSFAQIGVSTYGGLACVWMRLQPNLDGAQEGIAKSWIDKWTPTFLKLFTQFEPVATMSNGVTLYQEVSL